MRERERERGREREDSDAQMPIKLASLEFRVSIYEVGREIWLLFFEGFNVKPKTHNSVYPKGKVSNWEYFVVLF